MIKHINHNEASIFMDSIYSMIPKKISILVYSHPAYMSLSKRPMYSMHGLTLIKLDNMTVFNRIKFEYIKHIKSLPDPKDRVADFEYLDENSVPDFKKMERLIEKRKTRDEKTKELKEEIEMKQQCEKFKIEYFGPLIEQ